MIFLRDHNLQERRASSDWKKSLENIFLASHKIEARSDTFASDTEPKNLLAEDAIIFLHPDNTQHVWIK